MDQKEIDLLLLRNQAERAMNIKFIFEEVCTMPKIFDEGGKSVEYFFNFPTHTDHFTDISNKLFLFEFAFIPSYRTVSISDWRFVFLCNKLFYILCSKSRSVTNITPTGLDAVKKPFLIYSTDQTWRCTKYKLQIGRKVKIYGEEGKE